VFADEMSAIEERRVDPARPAMEHVPCPECGAPATRWRYCYERILCGLRVARPGQVPEHLHYTCERCGNEWGNSPIRVTAWPEEFREAEACPKCGEAGIHWAEFHAKEECAFPDVRRRIADPHMHRRCNRCGYEWATPPRIG